jgi:hypothetical protein
MPKGIPTFYNGVQFRSRLEAKWAAMFDLLKWPWEYEPFDLDGWIPDFALIGCSQDVTGYTSEGAPIIKSELKSVLVEVKPVDKFPADIGAEIANTLGENPSYEALICGFTPVIGHAYDSPCIGWLYDGEFDLAPWGRWEYAATLGFCHKNNSFHDRISGLHDGGRYGRGGFDASLIADLWAKAGNITQWKAPK